MRPPVPNLKGDRDIEYSWIAAHIPEGPGEAFEFGCGASWMGLLAARRGLSVTAVDLNPSGWLYTHPGLRFVHGDIFSLDLPVSFYDLIINCSTIEHVGLAGRYGVTQAREDGDLDAMMILWRTLKPGKTMLLTLPIGRDRVFAPFHRVYGSDRLKRILNGFDVVKREFWRKDAQNLWNIVPEEEAVQYESLAHLHALGLFVLRRPIQESSSC